MNRQKGNTLLIIVLIFAALVGFVIFQKQNKTIVTQNTQPTLSDETANWKTYTNTAYKYSISFPVNLKTQVQAAGSGVKEASSDSIDFYIYNSLEKESYINRYIEVNHFDIAPSINSAMQKSNVTIGNISAVKYSNNNPNSFDIYHLPILNKASVLEITVNKNPQISEIANKILSTFKFLDQGQSKDNSAYDFPIYPYAKISKVENTPDCLSISPQDQDRAKLFLSCDSVQYTYTPSNPFEQVVSWYENDESKSGWKLSGGGGAVGIERYGNLSNDAKDYWITITTNSFQIRVPKNQEKEGEDYIMNRGKKITIVRVKEGEYCEGYVGNQQTTYPKCESGFKCQQSSGSIADAPGICVKK